MLPRRPAKSWVEAGGVRGGWEGGWGCFPFPSDAVTKQESAVDHPKETGGSGMFRLTRQALGPGAGGPGLVWHDEQGLSSNRLLC